MEKIENSPPPYHHLAMNEISQTRLLHDLRHDAQSNGQVGQESSSVGSFRRIFFVFEGI
jgi:hypothetical protein